MVHTYRDPTVSGSAWTRRGSLAGGGLIVLLIALLLLGLKRSELTASEQWWLLGGVALMCGVGGLGGWWYEQRMCRAIRLDDVAGTCEFELIRRVLLLRVEQIRAVTYEDDADSQFDYRIRYDAGTILIENGMVGFHDFLERLEALHPTVYLSRSKRLHG